MSIPAGPSCDDGSVVNAATSFAGAVGPFLASDMADRPWLPITAIGVVVVYATVAILRSAWIALAALIGAILGAVAFLPIGSTTVDRPVGCESCRGSVTVLMGATFQTPYNGPRTATIGAIAGAALFALAAYGLTRFRRGKAANNARSPITRES